MENLKIYSETEALSKINRKDLLEKLRAVFIGLGKGESVQPPQTFMLFPKDDGDCIYYPAMSKDLGIFGVKVSPYISALAKAGKPPVTAYTLVMSLENGKPLLLCDSYALTTARTAATTILALDYLASNAPKKVAIIGSGKIALEHLAYLKEVKDLQEVAIFSPSLLKDSAKAANVLTRAQNIHANTEIAQSTKQALKVAQIVMLCTSSGTPVIDFEDLDENVVVTSISTNVAKAHEIAPEALPNFAVFCDFAKTAPLSAGEMLLAEEIGVWNRSKILGDLPSLILGGEKFETGRRFFRSTGLGIEDLAVASLLL